jgi:hypothetical protein
VAQWIASLALAMTAWKRIAYWLFEIRICIGERRDGRVRRSSTSEGGSNPPFVLVA